MNICLTPDINIIVVTFKCPDGDNYTSDFCFRNIIVPKNIPKQLTQFRQEWNSDRDIGIRINV